MTAQLQVLKEESDIRRAAKFARDARIIKLYYEGLSSGQIATKVGEKSGTVLAILNRHGAIKQ